MTTGVGQAETARLARCGVIGIGGALAIALFAPSYWVLAMLFVAVGCFGIWGLAAKRLHLLDILHRRAPALRLWLRLGQVAALTVGLACALLGGLGIYAMLTESGAAL